MLPQAAVKVTDAAQDLVLLWLWHRLVAATLIPPLFWELPCTSGAALKHIFWKERSKIIFINNQYMIAYEENPKESPKQRDPRYNK